MPTYIALMVLYYYSWIVIIYIVLSNLVAFNIVNMSNPIVSGLLRGLSQMVEPFCAPIRRILPDFGALDFSPMVLVILINFLVGFIQRPVWPFSV